jgi:predicted N-formylglutamate amidohydrolase
MAEPALIITCEHGGHAVPRPYRAVFKGQRELLASHRSYDLGALGLARRMAARFEAPLHAAVTSRLLVDMNRSIGHPRLFSAFTRSLPEKDKQRILREYYAHHRDPIEMAVRQRIAAGGSVVHIACHSFAPSLDGRTRSMDVGLLYDPRREDEHRFCAAWKKSLTDRYPDGQIRRNAPYKGVSDGLATYFRKHFAQRYIGIELEMNQHDYLYDRASWRRLCTAVIGSLQTVLQTHHRIQCR